VVLAVEAPQRREDLGEPDGVSPVGDLAQRGTDSTAYMSDAQDDRMTRFSEAERVSLFSTSSGDA